MDLMDKEKRVKSNIYVIFFLFSILFFSCNSSTSIKEVTSFVTEDSLYFSHFYHTLDGIYNYLNNLKLKHSNDVKLFVVGYSAKYHKPIPMIRLGNLTSHSYHMLLIGGIHGDEAIGVEAALYVLKPLLNLVNQNSPDVTDVCLDVIPVLNPDGFNDNSRKNGNGVNINRNFPFADVPEHFEPETKSIINLINNIPYQLSVFFHSANDAKYENVIRVPIEYHQIGLKAFPQELQNKFQNYLQKITRWVNQKKPAKKWELHFDYVNVTGLATDWIMAPLMQEKKITFKTNKHPHLALNIELCYPKQPQDSIKIIQEKEEALSLIRAFLRFKRSLPDYE